MPRPLRSLVGAALAVGIAVLLAVSESRLFDDAELSPLYRETLEGAYSRFAEADARVTARQPVGGLAGSAPAPQPMVFAEAAPRAPVGVPALQLTPELMSRYQEALVRAFQEARLHAESTHTPASEEKVAKLRAALQHASALPANDGGGTAGRGLTDPVRSGSDLLDGHSFLHPGGLPPGHDHDEELFSQAARLAARGAHEEALVLYELVLINTPSCADTHHRLGDTQRLLGRHDDAVSSYEAVLRLDPDRMCALIHMGDVWQSWSETERAAQSFASAEEGLSRQIQAGGPLGRAARHELARYYLDRNRNLDAALGLAEAAHLAEPTQPAALLLLARCYGALGRSADASSALDRLIALDPNHREAYEKHRSHIVGSPGNPAGDEG